MNHKYLLTALIRSMFLIAVITSQILATPITSVSIVNAAETPDWELSLDTNLYHIRAFQVYNEELYVSGHDGNSTNGTLYKYDGTEWIDMDMSEEIGGTLHLIDSLLVFNDRLYIGTSVFEGSLLSRVYYYDGGEFVLDLSALGTSGNAGIEALAVHNGALYAANGSLAGEVYMRVNENEWVTVGGSAIETGSPVRALASYNGYLYAGTGVSGDEAKVWKWTGSEWVLSVNFKTQHNTTKDGVVSLVVANDQLHAGTSGPGNTAYVFSFDGTDWVNTLEIPNCSSTWLSFANNTAWAGSNMCSADAYQLNNSVWESMGGANVNFVSFGAYNNHIFGGTVGDGKILSRSLDTIAPQVINIERKSINPTAATNVEFTLTFSEPVAGFEKNDLDLTASGVLGATIVEINGSGAIYTVKVYTGIGNGTIRLDIPAYALITDANGNQLANLPYLDGETYDIKKSLTIMSSASKDGWILESSEDSNLGGSLNVKSSTINLGDDASNRQYRAILSFTTTSVPTKAVITKVILRVKRQGVTGAANPVNTFKGFIVDIKKGNFGQTGLELSDFNSQTAKTLGAFKPAPSNNWYSINLTSAKSQINKSGTTQIRLRFKLDDNNDFTANFLKLYSGNASAVNRPQLVLEYYVP